MWKAKKRLKGQAKLMTTVNVIWTSFGKTRLKGKLNYLCQTPCLKTFFSVPTYSNSRAHLSAGHAVLLLPCCDESCYSRTNESASCNNLCSFKVSMSRSPFTVFLSFHFSTQFLTCLSHHLFLLLLLLSPVLPPLEVSLVCPLLLVLYFLSISPPPPYAMSKACQSKPGRQSCQYCLW